MTSPAIDRDVISRMKAERMRRGVDVRRPSFLSFIIYGFVMSCKKQNNVSPVQMRAVVSRLTHIDMNLESLDYIS